ncbi:Altered inheritance of mitochondria protein 18, mitochondrial [Penicillium subrubescens]|uniref:Altered inheritance of mitochondria protein 18, mitochondrial n=1 Tax=Penicillium subrubescens TaxID=1316194 RepID=A0A1Q5T0V2_9EURO|nr:Altered inheritance of mitochondria protein 18, mitochondrial [Penicillium subrubescens]
MSTHLRANPWRAYQCLARQRLGQCNSTARSFSTTHSLHNAANNPLRAAGRAKSEQDFAKSKRSIALSAAGMVVCGAAMYGVIKMDVFGLDALDTSKDKASGTEQNKFEQTSSRSMKMDGPPGFPSTGGPSVIPLHGQDNVDQVATGTSTIPYFPTTIRLPAASEIDNKQTGDELSTSDGDEYQLLGLGIRTVSFLSIQVYVVGLYVAKSDITELQRRLINTAIHPPTNDITAVSGVGVDAATSLVPPERQQLKDLLLDAERGDAAWTALIKDNGIRTAFRIVPTRNTDFMHLRDGWVRGITARAQQKKPLPGAAAPGEFQDAEFGTAMNDFKAVFGGGQRKNVPKGQTLVLLRGAQGTMDALFQPEPTKPMRWMGRVVDERVSRLVWLNYLAGKTVSSEGARQSIVDGLMAIVERPVGTVVQRVV